MSIIENSVEERGTFSYFSCQMPLSWCYTQNVVAVHQTHTFFDQGCLYVLCSQEKRKKVYNAGNSYKYSIFKQTEAFILLL